MKSGMLLIDANKAQAVLVNMAEHLLEAGNPEMAGAVGYAAEVIGKQKTVDAVEVVRCKDCKRGKHPEMTSLVGKYVKCALYNPMPMMRSSDFCSYGERRTDDGHS